MKRYTDKLKKKIVRDSRTKGIVATTEKYKVSIASVSKWRKEQGVFGRVNSKAKKSKVVLSFEEFVALKNEYNTLINRS